MRSCVMMACLYFLPRVRSLSCSFASLPACFFARLIICSFAHLLAGSPALAMPLCLNNGKREVRWANALGHARILEPCLLACGLSTCWARWAGAAFLRHYRSSTV
ncbi:hypothetical protein IWZ03DRAFT_382553 [Phyllosticta citriasiana]|uniref:Secreted protein n=1 Tax=Phyllosticta citriasiana TaxID=595635 RepID=A0ABR1KEZ0_9PEZI